MDHLPTIKDPAYPLPRIPSCCSAGDYDGQGMAGFPERVGWQVDPKKGPVRVDQSRSSISSAEGLLQAWLFFGFVYDVFSIGETPIDLHSLQQHFNGQFVLSTASLRTSLDQFSSNSYGLSAATYLDRQTRVRQCFQTILDFLDRHWNTRIATGNWKLSSLMSLDQILLLVILGETLKNAIVQVWPVPPAKSPIRWHAFSRRQNELKDRFLQLGWCPNEASMLSQELDNTGLLFASMLKRPFSGNLSHKGCNDYNCLALQTSEDTYETRHVGGCSSCEEIAMDQEKIANILQGGGNPILFIHAPREGETQLKVKILDFDSNSIDYYAISHVWAHGLGNPNANALPTCQLDRLQRLVRKMASSRAYLSHQPAFWIDTMCIPVNPKFKVQRKLAISRLDDTFRHARQVLVLDADLQLCSENCSRTELATRVLCSGWMRRLWTLSEAVVSNEAANARKVDIQLLERSIELNAVAGRSVMSIHHTEYALGSIFSAFPQFRARDAAFSFLARALTHRTTSRREDEPICLASILGLGSKNIALIAGANTAEERMHLFYTVIEQIPASILFHRSKSLEKGFRWAPRTLLGGLQRTPLTGPTATCDTNGLHVSFPGCIVTQPRPRSNWPSEPNVQGYYLGNVTDEAPKLWAMDRAQGFENSTGQSSLMNAIKFDKFMNTVDTPAFIFNSDDLVESALVSVSHEEEGVIYATYESKIYIGKPGGIRLGSQDNWRKRLLDVRQVSADQKWCIS